MPQKRGMFTCSVRVRTRPDGDDHPSVGDLRFVEKRPMPPATTAPALNSSPIVPTTMVPECPSCSARICGTWPSGASGPAGYRHRCHRRPSLPPDRRRACTGCAVATRLEAAESCECCLSPPAPPSAIKVELGCPAPYQRRLVMATLQDKPAVEGSCFLHLRMRQISYSEISSWCLTVASERSRMAVPG